MLTHLHIQNYALISHLDIDFVNGFSVLTGETGAGKSIILGALNLVMGGKADPKSITEGEKHCIIEATFDILNGKQKEDLIIRRELVSNGKSRSFINDELASQQELKQWASKLIDIHSQHESLLLENPDFQLNIVDAIAWGNNKEELRKYQVIFEDYQTKNKSLNELRLAAQKASNDADYIQYQLQQLEQANLQEGEEEELEDEQYRLSHAEEIKYSLSNALNCIEHDESGIISQLRSISIENVSQNLSERIQSVKIELEDISSDLQRLVENTEFDPARLETVEDRLQGLSTLKKKFHVQTISELIAIRGQLQQQCSQFSNYDEQICTLENELSEVKKKLTQSAKILTEKRIAACPIICEKLSKDLVKLGVQHAKVDIAISSKPDFTSTGIDDVQFLFAANLNQSLRRVCDVASGGEISRLMLCIKALIASTNGLPTILLDEIDTGVSGEIATQMGHIMQEMGESRQVIAITHLPQIAALGNTQYLVYKEDTEMRTETHIRVLPEEERVNIIAAMISGKQQSETAINMAQQLLNNRF